MVSFGPTPKKPRLIWAEGQASREILDLRLKIYEALGRKSEGRPFKLHLTLARFRPADFAAFPLKVLNEKVPWRERFGSFVLMRSRLSPQGADYEAVEEFKLG
jgi:2'-5' RNA ligase